MSTSPVWPVEMVKKIRLRPPAGCQVDGAWLAATTSAVEATGEGSGPVFAASARASEIDGGGHDCHAERNCAPGSVAGAVSHLQNKSRRPCNATKAIRAVVTSRESGHLLRADLAIAALGEEQRRTRGRRLLAAQGWLVKYTSNRDGCSKSNAKMKIKS